MDEERPWIPEPGTTFSPARIDRSDLHKPVTRNQRVMPDDEIKRMYEQRFEQEERWRVFSEENKARLLRYVAGAVICLPIVFFVLLPSVSFSFFHPFIHALFGAYVGFLRPLRMHAGLAFLACAALVVVTTREPAYFNWIQIFYGVLGVLGVGFMIGAAEESKLGI